MPLKHPPLIYSIAQLDRNDPVHFRKVTWPWWRHNPHCHWDYWNVMLHHSHFIASDSPSSRSICCVEFFTKENVRVPEVYCRHYRKIWAPVWLYAICRKNCAFINFTIDSFKHTGVPRRGEWVEMSYSFRDCTTCSSKNAWDTKQWEVNSSRATDKIHFA